MQKPQSFGYYSYDLQKTISAEFEEYYSRLHTRNIGTDKFIGLNVDVDIFISRLYKKVIEKQSVESVIYKDKYISSIKPREISYLLTYALFKLFTYYFPFRVSHSTVLMNRILSSSYVNFARLLQLQIDVESMIKEIQFLSSFLY